MRPMAAADLHSSGGARDWNGVRFDAARRGHVESYFFKLNDADGRRALWLKATILSRLSSALAVAEAWAIAFDRQATHIGVKEVVPYADASFSEERLLVKVANLHFSNGHIEGKVESNGHAIAFALDFTTDVAPLVHLSSQRLYEGRFPSSKFVTPHPDSRFTGSYSVDGAQVLVDGWRGMQGHNWGKQYTEHYGWGHCNQWDDESELVVEGITARVKIGRIVMPPTTPMSVMYRGVRYMFNRPSELIRSRGRVTTRSWSFRAKSHLARIEGELEADTDDFAGLYYENPDGDVTYCLNSKIACGRVRLEIEGRPPVEAKTRSAALEIGTKDPRHGIRMVA